MATQRDEVIQYKKIVERNVQKWKQETEKALEKDLDPIAEEIEELNKIKNPGPDEKKKAVDLQKAAREVIEKRMEASSGRLQQELRKVKRPEVDKSDNQSSRLMDKFHDDFGEGVEIEIPDAISKKYKALDSVTATVKPDDRAFSVGFKWSI